MKISLDELRERYVSCITDRTSDTRENCPSPEEIHACLRGLASKKAKSELVEHITRCSFCLQEFHFILEAQRLETELIEGVKKKIGLPSSRTMPFGEERNGRSRFARRSLHLSLKNPSRAVALAAFLLVIAAGTLYVSLYRNQSLRTFNQNTIRPIRPVDKAVRRTPLTFRWKKQKGAVYSIVELFDETLSPLWKSPKIPGNTTELPRQITDSLVPGSTYFWYVSCLTVQGQKIESPLMPFSIKN